MFNSFRHPTKLKYLRKNIYNQLWLAIVIVFLTCSYGTKCETLNESSLITKTENSTLSYKTHCESLRTCKECTTSTPACRWSLDKQLCNITTEANSNEISNKTIADLATTTNNNNTDDDDDSNGQSPLLVYEVGSCPKFSVSYTKTQNTTGKYQNAILKVTTENTEFVALLNRSQISCYLNGIETTGKLVSADQISCASVNETSQYDIDVNGQQQKQPPVSPTSIMYFAVAVAGVWLQFDSKSDNYVSENHNVCANQIKGGECVSCFWEDTSTRYYCRWCPEEMACTGLDHDCDVRKSIGYVRKSERVIVQCPEARITSIEPTYGPWGGGTTIKIGIVNHKLLSENKRVKVTVAGYRCLMPTQSSDGTAVTCTISPITNSNSTVKQLKDGPVLVEYMPMKDDKVSVIALQSEESFYFVEPEITSVKPMCGPITGGTQIVIHGNFLNAGNTLRVFINENVTCTITAHSENDVTCITGATDEPVSSKVKLQFDDYLKKYVEYPLFEYTGTPSVDEGQTFRAISSGGTRLSVRGRYLSCIQNPLVYVRYNGIQHTGACKVHNDTFMICTSPKINRPAPSSVTPLPCGFQADFNKEILALRQLSADTLNYLLYPDPVYTDFETDGDRTITINGLHLNQGYDLLNDLSVLLQNSSVAACNVTLVQPERILCQTVPLHPQSHGSIGSVDETVQDAIIVTVGTNVIYDVKRKVITYRMSAAYTNHIRLTVLLAAITLISLIVTVLVAVVHCTKIALTAVSGQHTEMQSCEQLNNNSSIVEEEEKK